MTHRLPTQRDDDARDELDERCPACLTGEEHVHHHHHHQKEHQ